MSVAWLSFTPAYTAPRGAQRERLGAHAFYQDPEVTRSVCGYVPTDKTNGPAAQNARRCVLCVRALALGSKVER